MIPKRIGRYRIIILKNDYDKVLTLLGEFGLMQIEQIDNDEKYLYDYNSNQVEIINGLYRRLDSLKNSLPVTYVKRIKIKDINHARFLADKIKIDGKVKYILDQIKDQKAKEEDLLSLMSILNKMIGFRYDLNILNSEMVQSYVCDKISDETLNKVISLGYQPIELKNYIIISINKKDSENIVKILDSYHPILIPNLRGKLEYNLKMINRNLLKINKKIKSLNDELLSLSKKYYSIISTLSEFFEIESQKLDILSKMKSTNETAIIEGWIPKDIIESVKNKLSAVIDGKFIIYEIKTNKESPTYMDNPASFKLYEFFIKFYSIPKSYEIDPTIFFGLAFPLFFGFMIGDAGYGILTLIISILAIKALNHKLKILKMPNRLSNFMHTITDNNTLLILFKSLIPGSIIAIILGILFNEYFGFSLSYPPVFSITKNVMFLLMLTGYIGLFMVSFGFILSIADALLVNDKKKAIGKVGWLITSLNIVVIGINLLNKVSMTNIYSLVAITLTLAGILIISISEGAKSLMELPSIISHILSYTRLLGILLASVILAEIINIGFLVSLNGPIYITILGFLLLLLGQLFNITITLFEAGIQGARLIYVEFFSKFLIGNGSLFKPFSIKRTFTEYIYRK